MFKRTQLRTIIVVGEGSDEVAFLKHLKSLYITRQCGISLLIGNGQGGGPQHVFERAIRITANQAHDVKGILMDTDIPWDDKLRKSARQNKIKLIPAAPCFEGLMLKILGHNVPQTTAECKTQFATIIKGSTSAVESYDFITKELLEDKRALIPELDELLNLICGH